MDNCYAGKNTARLTELAMRLDMGEASSIALALETENSILIIDEIKGRRIARAFSLEIIGTIGILLEANNKGLIKDVMSIIQKLKDKGFRLSDKVMEKLMEKYGHN